MTPIQALLLSIVEGITEFLPVSSTGHLILTAKLMGLTQTEFLKTFEIMIQLGAIAAVIFLYGKKVVTNKKILSRIFYAFLPTAIAGFLLYPFIKRVLFDNPMVVVSALFVGGAVLILLEHAFKQKNLQKHIEDLSLQQACIIGLVQTVSFIPGVSRAAATIMGGLWMGLSRAQAIELSFLLAIPTMIAAGALDLAKNGMQFSDSEYSLLGIGLLGSFTTALVVIKWFIGFIQKHTFIPFGFYRIIMAALYYSFFI